ncbi:MAG TPA: PD-(D/E)XK nuclease family protein [Acidimicrobiales bacterium]|nr:PD-(D/E)XK nuclease family protein [Acidimicrobiales bacterium]
MALPLPTSLTPSKVSSFTDCALAFRYSYIDRLPEAPSLPAARGTLVHRALERLFWDHDPGSRSPATAHAELAAAWDELRGHEEFTGLGLDARSEQELLADATSLVDGYFRIENPDQVEAVGVELTLEADVGGLLLRGIIDRLDRTPEGEFVVVDYKSGRAPSAQQEQHRLGGVQFYALLCEEVLGVRPAKVRLLYLRDSVSIEAVPSDQAQRGLRLRTAAVGSAIERACSTEDFRPKVSALCNWCSFKPLCPAHGGDPALAAVGGLTA